MDPFGDDEAARQYMLNAINEDTKANTTQPIGEEDARTADSFLICPDMPMKKMMTLRRRPISSSTFQYVS